MTEYPIRSADHLAEQLRESEPRLREILQTGATPRVIQRLRQHVVEPVRSILLESARLQAKANKKLGQHGPTSDEHRVWWVNDRSIQQATPWQVAKYKSQFLTSDSLVDLCCGIGGDALHFPTRASITAIDRDPLIAAMANVNLSRCDDPERIEVRCQDAESFPLATGVQLHIDPDRRVSDRRRTAPEHYEPNWQWVKETVEQFPAMVKLAPIARLSDDMLPRVHHRCWISLQRSVREQTLLCGDLVDRNKLLPSGRSAVMISADGTAQQFAPSEKPPPAIDSVQQPMARLIDPDPAIRAGELTAAFANAFGLSMLGGPSGFLTTDRDDWPEGQSMSVVSNVIWHGRCDLKTIRKELRDRNAFAETAKVRGTDHDPAKILKSLRKTGEQPVTLWIGRNSDRVYAALTT